MKASDHIDRNDPMAVGDYIASPEFQTELIKVSLEENERIQMEIAKDPSKYAAYRELQADFLQRVTFRDCIFRNNKQGDTSASGIPVFGMVSIALPFNRVIFENCRFENNLYDGSDGSGNGYAVQSIGAPVEIRDTCFEDNSFIGFGPVQLWAGAQLTSEGVYASDDDFIFCNFAALSDLPNPNEFEETTCVAADLASCGGPPLELSQSPTQPLEPTSSPSDGTLVFGSISLVLATSLLSLPMLSFL
jgi:hypothetical protein